MRTIHKLLAGAAVALVVATTWAQTAPSTTTAPATGRGRGRAGGGAGGAGAFGGAGGPGGGAARGGGRSILDSVAIQGNGNDKSMKVHEFHLTKAMLAKDGKALSKFTIDVYVEGDSIMRRWGCDPVVEPNYARFYNNWKETFYGYNAADFAWGADLIQNILWRLRNGELDDLNPKVVIFLGGTNNVTGSNNVDDMTKGLTACFDEIHKKAPDATLIIIGILPRQANFQPTIDAINANLAKLADGKKTRYLDMKSKYLDKDGKLVPGMLGSDSLHPDLKGYQAIGESLKPLLTELLGPPAKEDHAPPPTWDPSATNAPATYPKP